MACKGFLEFSFYQRIYDIIWLWEVSVLISLKIFSDFGFFLDLSSHNIFQVSWVKSILGFKMNEDLFSFFTKVWWGNKNDSWGTKWWDFMVTEFEMSFHIF